MFDSSNAAPMVQIFREINSRLHGEPVRFLAFAIKFLFGSNIKANAMSTLVTGATGFVGRRLLHELGPCTICSRNAQRAKKNLGSRIENALQWDPIKENLDLSVQPRFDSVINLMGEPIAEGRWTDAKKKRIRDSRVVGTRKLVDAILASGSLPKSFVSASAVGIYGDCGDTIVDETHPHGSGFLVEVCEEWEKEAARLGDHGVRVVNLRIGIVLGRDGGALAQLVPIFRWGLGGKLGNGKQWIPWIHVTDLVSLIVWGVSANTVSGPVNASAPNPVRNSELTRELAKQLKRPAFLPVPKLGVRVAVGEFANSLFDSQRVVPEVALSHGFHFQFSELSTAIKDVLS